MTTFTRQIKGLQLIPNVITIRSKLLCVVWMALHDIAFFLALASPVFGLYPPAVLNFGLPEGSCLLAIA